MDTEMYTEASDETINNFVNLVDFEEKDFMIWLI